MADNNNDEAASAEEDRVTLVDTKIERLQSDNPTEKLFSITFNDFEDLTSEKDWEVCSSMFSCFGSQWRMTIYPGGRSYSSDGMVAVYLERCTEGRKLAFKYSFELSTFDGCDRIRREGIHIFEPECDSWGWDDFCSRNEITGILEEGVFVLEGALTIRVSIQLDEFIPKNPASSIMLKLFDDEKSADIVFEICDQQKAESESDGKGAKISTAKILYHAHRLILQHYSPELCALCTSSDGITPIIITDVKPEVFRHLLYYVYGGEISDEEYVDNEKDLINAADKYGITNLKLEAEVWYVDNKQITIDNVIDNLLYADARNCALLKETVMDFIVENKEKVMQQVSFQDVPGEVCKDLLAAVSRYYFDFPSIDDDDDETTSTYSNMRIRDLREKLSDKGLDIDGSREALIASLKGHSYK